MTAKPAIAIIPGGIAITNRGNWYPEVGFNQKGYYVRFELGGGGDIPPGHEIAFWLSDDGQPSAGLKNVATGKIVGPLPNAMLKEIREFGMKYRARTIALFSLKTKIDRKKERKKGKKELTQL